MQAKSAKADAEKDSSLAESLHRKITLLEGDLEKKEKEAKDASSKARNLELSAESAERRAELLEKEKTKLEKANEELEVKLTEVCWARKAPGRLGC